MVIMNDITPGPLPSGRFLLRIDPELHALLRDEAEGSGLSLNEYCDRRLPEEGLPFFDVGPGVGDGIGATAFHHATLPCVLLGRVQRAVAVTEGHLRGLLVFGSWARKELVEDSDVDLLVVADPDLKVERSLYRRWDASPVRWQGRRVEPHLVHLPGPDDRVTGLWAEAALDGVVLFDPDFSVSRYLVRVRKRILAGTLIRREIHGHPYWVEAA